MSKTVQILFSAALWTEFLSILIDPLYNYQVNNRDISIAVLRTFISKRKQEYEALLSKRTKSAQKVSEKDSSESVKGEVPSKPLQEEHKSNGECEVDEERSPEESSTTTEESIKINGACSTEEELIKNTEEFSKTGEHDNITEGKGVRELNPPRVLEVFYCPFI